MDLSLTTSPLRPTLLALALIFTAATASAKVTEHFAKTYPLTATGSIELENVNGSVEIVAWDRAEVSLEAEKSARTEEGLARMHLKIEASPDQLSIRTEYEKKWKFWDHRDGQVRYKLMVPAGANLDKIEVVNARIHLTGLTGRVKAEAVNGNIEAEGLGGPGNFETVNGNIHVTYAALPATGHISLETVNGSCAVSLPADAAFDLATETVNGHISCDFPLTLGKSGKHELRGRVNGGGAQVSLESVNGGLSVARSD